MMPFIVRLERMKEDHNLGVGKVTCRDAISEIPLQS